MKQTLSSCAFTGHRPRSFSFGDNEDHPDFFELRERIKNTIIQVCNKGCRTFYCGMAEGADLWCAEIVLEMKDNFQPPLQICAVVPYLAQPASMTPKNQRRYRLVMEQAKERFLVSKEYQKNCFQKRNFFLVDATDALIAVFSEKESRSGTAQTLRYAKKKNKTIFLVSP